MITAQKGAITTICDLNDRTPECPYRLWVSSCIGGGGGGPSRQGTRRWLPRCGCRAVFFEGTVRQSRHSTPGREGFMSTRSRPCTINRDWVAAVTSSEIWLLLMPSSRCAWRRRAVHADLGHTKALR